MERAGRAPTLRILTYNVLFGGSGREQLLRGVVSGIRPDIAIFTEARATASFDVIADTVGAERTSRRSGLRRHRESVAHRRVEPTRTAVGAPEVDRSDDSPVRRNRSHDPWRTSDSTTVVAVRAGAPL